MVFSFCLRASVYFPICLRSGFSAFDDFLHRAHTHTHMVIIIPLLRFYFPMFYSESELSVK